MASSLPLFRYSHRSSSSSLLNFLCIPTSLALLTSLLILFYISTTSNLFTSLDHAHLSPTKLQITTTKSGSSEVFFFTQEKLQTFVQNNTSSSGFIAPSNLAEGGDEANRSHKSFDPHMGSKGNKVNNEVFHDKHLFLEDYKEMKRSFKIYVYPHSQDEPFANVLLPVESEPGGNYASESYFKKALMRSHFITEDPREADLFYMPFSIATMRHDRRIGVGGIQDFVKDYIFNISHKYPYWNRSGGADHFYVACHSIGRSAMDKAEEVKYNAIQVVCSSSYFLTGYVAHKDASMPQIWPRKGEPPNLVNSERKKLAFFAGAINSLLRKTLIDVWRNDSEIFAHFGRLKTPYADELLGSKYCLHVKGFEVNTARAADALYYGCVPVILANHYDLPFADILNWNSFSVVVDTLDIPLLKKILKDITHEEYSVLQSNVIKVRKHFQWHSYPKNYDAFYMVMYELWLRRSSIRLPISTFVDI